MLMKYTKGQLILKMENPFNGIIIKKEDIIDTSHSDKNNHGLGLESVKTVLKKYDGATEFKYDDSKFHMVFLMFV